MGRKDLERIREGEIHDQNILSENIFFFNKKQYSTVLFAIRLFLEIVFCAFTLHTIYKMLDACMCDIVSTFIIQAFDKVALSNCRLMEVP